MLASVHYLGNFKRRYSDTSSTAVASATMMTSNFAICSNKGINATVKYCNRIKINLLIPAADTSSHVLAAICADYLQCNEGHFKEF